MTREHLYKSKSIDNGEWVEGVPYGEYMICGMTTAYYDDDIPMSKYAEFDYVEVDPSTVCEYTGLQDKNGKKIFEGDIVETHDYYGKFMARYLVVYDSGAFMGKRIKGTHKGYPLISEIARCEVIGNAIDNPELLEVE